MIEVQHALEISVAVDETVHRVDTEEVDNGDCENSVAIPEACKAHTGSY